MLKKKVLSFMEKHPKLTGFTVSTVCSVPVAVSMASSIVASADDNVVASATSSLVTSAQTAFTDAVTQITPVLCTVIGFNVVVRLVRRFIKG